MRKGGNSLNCSDNNKCRGGCAGALISLAAAATVGVLFAYNRIPHITVIIWILFGLAAFSLALLSIGLFAAMASRCPPLADCLCFRGKMLLAGIIGTLATSLTALAVTLVSSSVWMIVLVALTVFFAVFMLAELIAALICITSDLCS
jgi:hypothetical protein